MSSVRGLHIVFKGAADDRGTTDRTHMPRPSTAALICLPMLLAVVVLVVAGAEGLAIAIAVVCAVMLVGMATLAARDGGGRSTP